DEGDERGDVECDDTPFRTDAFSRDLRPSARRSAEANHDSAFVKQAIPPVDLGQLDRRPAAVRLLLRGPIEAIVVAGLDPGLAHRSERCRQASIILSSAAGLTC